MEKKQIKALIQKQRNFFLGGTTMSAKYRKNALIKLKNAIKQYELKIMEALKTDLGKSETESYMSEIGMVYEELTYMIKHVKKFAKDRKVRTPLAQFPAKSFVSPKPYGTVLIMSPWNYPFLLTLGPMVDAISAGNTAIVKPSAYSPATSDVIKELLSEFFDEEYVAVVTGGRKENEALLEERFDYIMFTGSPAVGKTVMNKASNYLTPVTLELGGKSPCIVDETADIDLAAKRIVFGKFMNCGQTCVAPDYVYCDKKIKDKLIAKMIEQIAVQYGKEPLKNPDYGRIVNQKHFERICGLINADKVVCGGETEADSLRISPTIMDNAEFTDAVMLEEIFGPVLPVLTFNDLNEALEKLHTMEHPLATYIFSKNKSNIKLILDNHQFGGGCINDTIIHLASTAMGFGGIGNSGMGSYHGKNGFDTFTHYRSIVKKSNLIDMPMRYQPYTDSKLKLIRKFMK